MPAAKTRRVAVVGDRESMCGVVRAYARRPGVDNVDMAESGSEALKQHVEKVFGALS